MIGRLVKAFQAMRHGGSSSWLIGMMGGRQRYKYQRDVGIGIDASVVMAPVLWLQRNLPEAPLALERKTGQGKRVERHPLLDLLETPNDGYAGDLLLEATAFSLCTGGNGYWVKIRNGVGKVVELWYAPHWLMHPRWPQDGSRYISHYEYRPAGETFELEPEDVVHFRVGIDPLNTRLGIAPLRPVLREIWSDMEAAGYVASLLRNSGVPGLVVSPDGPHAASAEDVKEVKRYLREEFTGEKRGESLVMSSKTKVDRVGLNPAELNLASVSDRAEERVCALLGIPPVVVGFHAGSSQTSVGATMHEQVRLAWQNGVVPMQRIIARGIARSLLPDFERDARGLRVYFDTSEVEAMQEERDKLVTRADRMVAGGWVQVSEARQMAGLPTDATHEIYLRRFGTVEVPGATGRMPEQESGLMGEAPSGRKHRHSPFEERIAASAPHAEPSPEGERFVLALEAQARRLARRFERRLAAFFAELGAEASSVATPILEDAFKGAKNTALNLMVTERVIEALGLPEKLRIFREQYERHYLETAEGVAKLAGRLGLGTSLPDRVGRAVIATGGRRAGLVDLSTQTRDAVLRAVAEQRALGAGPQEIARAIAGGVPAGPWASERTRALVIARTETKFAQNVSVYEHARANGVERFQVFDARLGESDEICEALDGAIVTADEARELMETEHPNGTRSFSPYFG